MNDPSQQQEEKNHVAESGHNLWKIINHALKLKPLRFADYEAKDNKLTELKPVLTLSWIFIS